MRDRLTYIPLLTAFVVFLAACGSDNSTKPRTKKDGRILVRNDTDGIGPFVAEWFNEETKEVVTTPVEPGEMKDVCGVVFEGGTEVKLTISVNDRGYRGSEEITVTIDGNVTIRIISMSWNGTGHFEYELL